MDGRDFLADAAEAWAAALRFLPMAALAAATLPATLPATRAVLGVGPLAPGGAAVAAATGRRGGTAAIATGGGAGAALGSPVGPPATAAVVEERPRGEARRTWPPELLAVAPSVALSRAASAAAAGVAWAPRVLRRRPAELDELAALPGCELAVEGCAGDGTVAAAATLVAAAAGAPWAAAARAAAAAALASARTPNGWSASIRPLPGGSTPPNHFGGRGILRANGL